MRSLIPYALLLWSCGGSAGIDVPGAVDGPDAKADDPQTAAEPCNGVDDDDDGLVDLDPAGNPLSRPCETECGGGNEYCEGGTWVCYAPTAREEVCDNFDNDCDGEVDEICECRVGDTQECGPESVGVCHRGSQTCRDDGTWSECSGGGEPGTETCGNGLDDDCNGETDEACGCTPGTEQPCGGEDGECVAGRQVCDETGGWGDCEGAQGPSDEVCNGLDDNCDGTADERWGEDDYEGNDSCDRRYDLGTIEQDGQPLLVPTASLFSLQDADWYSFDTIETDDWCVPGTWECSHRATLRLSLEEALDPADVEICAFDGQCADGADTTRMVCSHLADWREAERAFALPLVWGGTCGADDARRWQVVVRTTGDGVCGAYALSVTYDLADLECPE